jgi:hypothetical protein
MSDRPLFMHDCAECVFLGHYDKHDLYFCAGSTLHGTVPTVVARFDHDSLDYKSGMALAGSDKHLHEAYERAKVKRLLLSHKRIEEQWSDLIQLNEKFGDGDF